jgi:putative transposase
MAGHASTPDDSRTTATLRAPKLTRVPALPNLRPRVAARSKWARIEALLRNRAFLVDYAAARAGWHEGATVRFPIGTYWLRRFANVPIAAA